MNISIKVAVSGWATLYLKIEHTALTSYCTSSICSRKEQFQEQGYNIPLHDMEAAMFFMISCFGGFGGYETVWTDLAALRYNVQYSEDQDDPAVAWPVTGRFKNEHGVWGHYYIPIAGVTGSGVCIFDWTQRFIARLGSQERFFGFD